MVVIGKTSGIAANSLLTEHQVMHTRSRLANTFCGSQQKAVAETKHPNPLIVSRGPSKTVHTGNKEHVHVVDRRLT